ncbi:MAG: hypothetical protein LIO75_01735 [Lachnospiraceae bacterium]|nr:hypothetical protein [Lachnospiraceae bacterium]
MMDMKRKTNKTMNAFCAACGDSDSCDARKAMPPLPENLPDELLRFYLDMKMLGFFAEVIRDYESESEPDDEEENSDDEKITVQLFGAEPPEVMTFGEAFLDFGDFPEEFERLDDFMGEGLTLYYDPDEVERFSGKMYLTGAGVVCSRDEDDELCSLSGEDIYLTLGWAERQRVTLSRNGEKIPALRIN